MLRGDSTRKSPRSLGREETGVLRYRRGDRGAAAVEFALILPVLMLIVIGIIEYGYYFSREISVTNAALVGARSFAVGNSAVDAKAAAALAASVDPSYVTVPGTACSGGNSVTVTISKPYASLTGFPIPLPATLNSMGTARCES